MLDLVITTETWLTDQDYLWLKATELNRNNLQIHNVNRQHSKGGGLALICRGTYAVKTLKIVTNEIAEIVTWAISIGTKTVHITGVYHPPPKNGVTNMMFIIMLTDYLTTVLPTINNNTSF